MSSQELCFLTAAQQSRLIRSKEVSPVDVVESTLRQIERVDGRVNAYITVMGESALEAAREAEREIARGNWRGPLHGIPIALKDIIYVRGVRNTAGSSILKDFVPSEDATVTTRLRQAGAIIVGKNNMHEFAFGPLNTNPHFGDAHNPWDLERVTGGSSGGSAAAVAASMCSAALGTDTGGSIRIPAAFCGVFGIKPTYGRVSRYAVTPCAWSLDNVGPLTRTAEDSALVLSAIAGWDPKDPASSRKPVQDYAAALSQPVSGLKVAVLREYVTDPLEPAVVAGFRSALEVLRSLGMAVEEVSIPEVNAAIGASTAILFAEVAAYHQEDLRTRQQDIGPDVRSRLEQGSLIAATDYVNGQRVRRLLIDRFRALMKQYDAVVCPTEPATAPRLDQEIVQYEGFAEPRGATATRHTRLFNLTSQPAASVPCGFAPNGLPIAMQIAAAPFDETTVLRIAHAYQQATDWHLKTPPVAAPAHD
ncbi:MAG: amidase [Sphingomonadaceae bacterium]